MMISKKEWYEKNLFYLLLSTLLLVFGVGLFLAAYYGYPFDGRFQAIDVFCLLLVLIGGVATLFVWRDAEKELHELPSFLEYALRILVFLPLRFLLAGSCLLLVFVLFVEMLFEEGLENSPDVSILFLIFLLLILGAVNLLVFLIEKSAQEETSTKSNTVFFRTFILGWRVIKRGFMWD